VSWSLAVPCPEAGKDLLSAELFEQGATGIVEEDHCLRAFFALRNDAVQSEFGGVWREEADRDWVSEWERTWKPIALGRRLFLIPDWMDNPTPVGRVRIEMHPGRAYGTGTSEATQLALLGLERHLKTGGTLLDVGTGTGILSVAAVRLGARSVIACDIDVDSVDVADANIHRDDITVHLFAGSVKAVASESVDTIVANINATTIGMLAADLWRVLRPGGRLITSGFLTRDVDRVRLALAALQEIDRIDDNDWLSLIYQK
jgi:ribosomal protein L11 methyltransferase